MNHPLPNPLDEIDQQIDRTLSALGHMEPASDFHDRLLRGLDGRVEAATRSDISGGPGIDRLGGEANPVLQWFLRHGFAATALAAGLALLLLLPHKGMQKTASHPRADPPQTSEAPRVSGSPSVTESGRSPTYPANSARIGTASRPPTLTVADHAPARRATHLSATLEVSLTAPTDPDQQAFADFQAPSQPAPPLPLTSQERLVRLMLRRGEKHDLAQLNPDGQALFAEQEQTAFHEFFDPSPDPRVRAQLDGTDAASPKTPSSQGATK